MDSDQQVKFCVCYLGENTYFLLWQQNILPQNLQGQRLSDFLLLSYVQLIESRDWACLFIYTRELAWWVCFCLFSRAQIWKRVTACTVWLWQETTTVDLHCQSQCQRGTLYQKYHIAFVDDWGFYKFDKSVFFLLHHLLVHGPSDDSKDGKQKTYGVDS